MNRLTFPLLALSCLLFVIVAFSHHGAKAAPANPSTVTHKFLPLNPRWVVHESFQAPSYYDGVMTSYMGVEPKSAAEKRTLFRELRYFEPGHEKDVNDYVKVVTYRPGGALVSLFDCIKKAGHEEQWSAYYYRNGKQSSLNLWRDGLTLVATSTSPDGKTRTGFTNGAGRFTQWSGDGVQERQWFEEGRPYLIRTIVKGRTLRTELNLPTRGFAHLLLTTSGEDLYLGKEQGTKPTGQPGKTYPMGHPSTPALTRGAVYTSPAEQAKRQRAAREAQARYVALRAEFLQQYEAYLASIGQSLRTLGIESVRQSR